ncbi:MAG: hypothetical protein JWP91_3693 [Fibrobacteres bacterium]|nr:hypothetical protein [Fibrobacterota bacterium]
MPLGSRTEVRSVSILVHSMIPFAVILAALLTHTGAQPSPVLPKPGATAPMPRVDTAKAVAPPNTRPDSLAHARLEGSAPGDSAIKADSGSRETAEAKKRRAAPVFTWQSPLRDIQECPGGMESAPECWRRSPDLANQEVGWAGTRAWTLSLTHWRPLPQESPYFPFWSHSPYLSGGLLPPDRFALGRIGGDLTSLEEAWTPVVPLDTPVTRMDWMRGALSLNIFDLKLNRMLSDRVYLGMDYYSSTALAQQYNYQFNVHQPYLGGWGFLGRLYPPIDRDSASLVLEDTSFDIHALHMRPRVGVWLDTNRVVEFFLDRVSNSTSLTYPYGRTRPSGSLIPAGPDSTQALMPSDLKTLTEGAIYGESHAGWTSQMELSHGAMDLSEFRKSGSAKSSNTDEIHADVFRARGSLLATGLPFQPMLSAEARSDQWEGDPLLAMAGTNPTEGWSDAEGADLEVRPVFSFLRLKGNAGIGRSSRMDDKVYWLPRFGAVAGLDLPYGFGAEASASTRREDPEWEMLYRTNPARFRFASPELLPRTDQTLRGSVSWAWSRLAFQAGIDRMRGEDAWLPRVLPNPGACGALADSIYAPLAGRACGDTSGSLPDTLALGMRNYESEVIDAWHLGLGLGLGNWSLSLDNRFVLNRTVDDPDLKATLEDWSVPERVFKGRLGWKRALLDDRLKLDLAWDWEWYSTRYAWVPDLAGGSRVGKLDEYLALDFNAAMKIKTFTLFFKVRNFNHDRYATEPGVHPPGINFRFGVDWTIFN